MNSNNKFTVNSGDSWHVYVELSNKGKYDVRCEVWGQEAQRLLADPQYKVKATPGITQAILTATETSQQRKDNFNNVSWLKAEIAKQKRERDLRQKLKPQVNDDRLSKLFKVRDEKIRNYILMLKKRLVELENNTKGKDK